MRDPLPILDHHLRIGQMGEAAARAFVIAKGWTIHAVDWRPPAPLRGDIDIIADDGTAWVFIEVRTRSATASVSSGDAEESAYASITPRKRTQMVRLAHSYLTSHGLDDVDWRIDAIAVSIARGQPPRISHTEDALDW